MPSDLQVPSLVPRLVHWRSHCAPPLLQQSHACGPHTPTTPLQAPGAVRGPGGRAAAAPRRRAAAAAARGEPAGRAPRRRGLGLAQGLAGCWRPFRRCAGVCSTLLSSQPECRVGKGRVGYAQRTHRIPQGPWYRCSAATDSDMWWLLAAPCRHAAGGAHGDFTPSKAVPQFCACWST